MVSHELMGHENLCVGGRLGHRLGIDMLPRLISGKVGSEVIKDDNGTDMGYDFEIRFCQSQSDKHTVRPERSDTHPSSYPASEPRDPTASPRTPWAKAGPHPDARSRQGRRPAGRRRPL